MKKKVNTTETERANEIIRIQKKRSNFVILDKGFIEDERLSLKAKGLLAYLLSKPDQWKVIVKDIENHCADGEYSIYNGLKELKQFGYYNKEPVRNEQGKITHWESVVFECPEERTEQEKTAKKNKQKGAKPRIKSESYPFRKNPHVDSSNKGNFDKGNYDCNKNYQYQKSNSSINDVSINQSDPKTEKETKAASPPIDMIDTNAIKIYSAEEVADKISLAELKDKYTDRHEEIDMLYNITCEVLTVENPVNPTFRISRGNIPFLTVKNIFSDLEMPHFEYVLSSLEKNGNKYKIKDNAESYLRTSLFHAPRTITYYYDRKFKEPPKPKDKFTELWEKKMQRDREKWQEEKRENEFYENNSNFDNYDHQ